MTGIEMPRVMQAANLVLQVGNLHKATRLFYVQEHDGVRRISVMRASGTSYEPIVIDIDEKLTDANVGALAKNVCNEFGIDNPSVDDFTTLCAMVREVVQQFPVFGPLPPKTK